MKRSESTVAAAGVALLLLGSILTFHSSRRYNEKRLLADAGACRVDLDLVQLADLPDSKDNGSVVLFHGLSANKVIMSYLAHSFAEEGLRVYVPDLPGHGRTGGNFTPDAAETCSISLLRGMSARGLIQPDRTILAGHSMGAAIALRVASRFRPAGVVAISPAPMQSAHGVTPEALLYQNPPALPSNALILVGQLEPHGLVDNAADLAASNADSTDQYVVVGGNTHVSVLFSPAVARDAQTWAARVLKLPDVNRLPSRANLLGGVLGLAGIILLAGPFLREAVGHKPAEEAATEPAVPLWRAGLELLVVSAVVLAILRYWIPLRVLHLFEGDYLASFFLLAGFLLLLIHPRAAQRAFSRNRRLLLPAALAAFMLHLLVTGWFQLTVTGAWLTLERWQRFPLFFLGAFLFLYAVEILVGPAPAAGFWNHYRKSLAFMLLAWLTLAAGVLYLHSGMILLVLLSPYFALFFILSRLGVQLVRRNSGSPTVAALFGAILMAGFCLVIFPVT